MDAAPVFPAPASAPAPALARVARRGLIPFTGRLLLLGAIPLSILWYPIGRVPGAGTVTASDAVLMTLWAVVALEIALHGFKTRFEPLLIVALAMSIATLAGIGAEVDGVEGTGVLEGMFFMKRFGLAAILPVAAALFATSGTRGWARALSAIAVASLVVSTLQPSLVEMLPRPDDWDPSVWEGRAAGMLTNPNDLGYAAVSLALLHAALLPRRPGILGGTILAAVLAGAAVCLSSSGSRSAALGAAVGLVFLLLSSRERLEAKAGMVAAVAVALGIGLSSSSIIQERMASLYTRGVQEENVASRLDAQRLAARTALEHPLGVGYSHFALVTGRDRTYFALTTADSAYFDTLLGAGFLGLFAFLGILWAAWRHVGGRDRRHARVLQTAIVAFMVYATATVVPISVFLSPLFFHLVAAASYCDADPA